MPVGEVLAVVNEFLAARRRYMVVPNQGEAELTRVVADIERWVSVYKIQGRLYAGQGRAKEALEALNRYLAHHPQDLEAIDLRDSLRPPEEKEIEEGPPMVERAVPADEEPLPEEEEEVFSALATPTLAEIYYNQGQIQEAIRAYEKVVSDNPEDRLSMARLAELKASGPEEDLAPDMVPVPNTAKKERMISILEAWLAKVQKLNHAG